MRNKLSDKDTIWEIAQEYSNKELAQMLDEALGFTELVDIIHELGKIKSKYITEPYELMIFTQEKREKGIKEK